MWKTMWKTPFLDSGKRIKISVDEHPGASSLKTHPWGMITFQHRLFQV